MNNKIRTNLGTYEIGDHQDFERWRTVAAQSDGARAREGDDMLPDVVGALPIYVDCPKCQGMSTVRFAAFNGERRQGRWACECGYALRLNAVRWFWPLPELRGRLIDDDRRPVIISPLPTRVTSCIEDDLSPIWLRLSLQTSCAGEILWAFNEPHLLFIENYVGAKVRERLPNTNDSLASRLPKWMLSAKNREAVLDAAAALRVMLAEFTRRSKSEPETPRAEDGPR